MEGIKNKLTTFSFWFVIFQPIIDIITSIMVRFISPQLTIGVVTRALFVVFIVVYVLFFYDNKCYTISYGNVKREYILEGKRNGGNRFEKKF